MKNRELFIKKNSEYIQFILDSQQNILLLTDGNDRLFQNFFVFVNYKQYIIFFILLGTVNRPGNFVRS